MKHKSAKWTKRALDAISTGNEKLLDKCANPKIISKIDKEYVTTHIDQNSYKQVERLVCFGFCADKKLSMNRELYASVLSKHDRGVIKALDAGANPDIIFDGISVLKLAVNNKNYAAAKILLDAGAEESYHGRFFNNYTYAGAANSDDYDMMMLFMERLKSVSYDDIGKTFRMRELMIVYNQPEHFLELNLELTDKEVEYFKRAAMYGMLKVFKEKQKNKCVTEEYEAKNAELVEKINKKADAITRPDLERDIRIEKNIKTLSSTPVQTSNEKTK